MKTSWWIGLMLLFVVCTIVVGVCEMKTMGAADTARLQALLSPELPKYTNPITTTVAYIAFSIDYMGNLWSMFWFDYPTVFSGSFAYVKYLFWCVSIAVVISFIIVLRGVPSG